MNNTAVEWLVNELTKNGHNFKLYKKEINQAKEMEKQHHGETWDASIENYKARGENYLRAWEDFDDYYKETFNK